MLERQWSIVHCPLSIVHFQFQVYRLAIALYDRAHIFWPACTSFDLKHAHAGIYHLIEEPNRLEVLGRHNIFIVHLKLDVCLLVLDDIAAPADLHALAAVGRASCVLQAQVAFARYGHAERSVAEHLYSHLLSAWSADILIYDGFVNLAHLVNIKFAREHHYVGKLGIEAQGLSV